eukprot:SM006360S20092  [mRNA]  locus=s6360:150:633:- [translate_table: standard]
MCVLHEAIDSLQFGPDALTASEYIDLPGENQVESPMTDEDIIAEVMPPVTIVEEEISADLPPPRMIHAEASDHLRCFSHYLAQELHFFGPQALLTCEQWRSSVTNCALRKKKQTTIEDYVASNNMHDE